MPGCRIIGISLDDIDAEGFRRHARGALDEFSTRKVNEPDWNAFAEGLDYVPLTAGPAYLAAAVNRAQQVFEGKCGLLHYLSVPPNAALPAIKLLHEADLVKDSRVVMEKPFGTDLSSARTLNAKLHEVFAEEQIFRIDHFLGKEPAQNILAFRFANGLFEPIWNRNFIDHVQIDVPEKLSIGKRTAFYETTGAYRDMVVTHLFQILAFTAMEPPTALEPRSISEEKNKVFRSMLPVTRDDVVRGQYIGYRSEEGVDPRVRYRDLHRAQVLARQLALGGRPILPAHRQTHGGRPADHLHRFPRGAEKHVPTRIGRGIAGPGSPHFRSGRLLESVAVLLRQAAGSGNAPRQAQHAVCDARYVAGK